MQENQIDLLSERDGQVIQRKQMLPTWIKVFTWIFLVIAAFAPITLILRMLGYNTQLAIYGLETNEAFSTIGVTIVSLLLIKGITSIGFLKETDWAIKLGIIDAIFGISICLAIMIYSLVKADVQFSFRLEVLLLLPYLFRLAKIKTAWESSSKLTASNNT